MKMKRYIATLAMLLMAVPAMADDGLLTRTNVSKTPALHTEHASMKMLSLCAGPDLGFGGGYNRTHGC